MKNIPYQQNAINELTDKTIRLLNLGGKRHKIVFEAPTGAGKTVMTCQALANITDELIERGDSRYQEVAYIWFAPRKLHLQSYASLKNVFGETRKLRPVIFDEIDQSEGIQPGEILFVNWESVNKESNVMVRENESFASLYEIARRTQEEYDRNTCSGQKLLINRQQCWNVLIRLWNCVFRPLPKRFILMRK